MFLKMYLIFYSDKIVFSAIKCYLSIPIFFTLVNFFKKLLRKGRSTPFIPQPPAFLTQNHIYPIGSIEGCPQAHASNIIVGPLQDGIQTLFTAWFCGTREGNRDVAIFFSTIHYQTQTDPKEIFFEYSVPIIIADHEKEALGNPVLFLDKKNILHLWYVSFIPNEDHHGRERNRNIFHQTSPDFGETWTTSTLFSDRTGLWIRNNVVVLQDGTWLLPLNDETTMHPETKTYWSSRFAHSKDEGKTWTFTDLFSIRKGIIQPSVVQFEDGSLYCLNRSRTGWIVEMHSRDGGNIWTKPQNMTVPNNNSNVCVIKRDENELLLIYNPVKRGRTPISIAQSKDKGKTWFRLFDLQTQPGVEFSYPCMIETPDGLIHAVYTFRREGVSHDVFLVK